MAEIDRDAEKQNGNFSKIVTLVSSDNFEFIIPRDAALVSGTLKGMLSSDFEEARKSRVVLQEISGELLEKICEYLLFNYKYSNASTNTELPEFEISPEIALELYVAADFLNV